MPKARSAPLSAAPPVTPDRAARLYRLVEWLIRKPQTRLFLTQRLGIGVRDFYRDLEVLRTAGIEIGFTDGRYSLFSPAPQARDLIPFPNPCLSLGEAETLSRGRSTAHRRLRQLVDAMTGPTPVRRTRKR